MLLVLSQNKQTMYSLNQIEEWLVAVTEKGARSLHEIDEKQLYCPGGHNGPYYDIESPVRNTAHWLISICIAFQRTQDSDYKELAQKLRTYLIETPFLKNGVYIHRQKKDWANGVIGQAWILEALAVYNRIFDHPKKPSEPDIDNVFSFNSTVKAWERIDPKNNKSALDYTLNHQLWYAASLLEYDFKNHHKHVEVFLELLHHGSFKVRKNGLICHLLYGNSLKANLLQLRYKGLEKRKYEIVIDKENGYHLFNLYPLARIYRHLPNHPFFTNQNFKKALSYCFSTEFKEAIELSPYAYPYNAPGFEIPLIVDIFYPLLSTEEQDQIEPLKHVFLNQQIEKTYSINSINFSKGCPDPMTLTARIYEYWLGQHYKAYKKE